MNETDDLLFGGALRLRQPAKGHRAGLDGVLLAAALPTNARAVADLGASTGLVGLRAARMNPEARITLIEKEPELAVLARHNIALNGLSGRVDLFEADAFSPALRPLREQFDCVLTNPPFHEAGTARVPSEKAGAYVMAEGAGLDRWLRVATTLLKPRGSLVMIHRADRLADILAGLDRRFGAITLRFIHPRRDEPAIRLLASGIKGSRAPLSILPPLVLHEAEGRPTPESAAIHAGTKRIE